MEQHLPWASSWLCWWREQVHLQPLGHILLSCLGPPWVPHVSGHADLLFPVLRLLRTESEGQRPGDEVCCMVSVAGGNLGEERLQGGREGALGSSTGSEGYGSLCGTHGDLFSLQLTGVG